MNKRNSGGYPGLKENRRRRASWTAVGREGTRLPDVSERDEDVRFYFSECRYRYRQCNFNCSANSFVSKVDCDSHVMVNDR